MLNYRTRRTIVIALALAGVAACSKSEERPSGDVTTLDAEGAAAERSAAPGIVPTAAPGVAFSYRYGFRLPDDQVSAAQEAHAAACEKLGLDRCRITGMTYELDEHDRVQGTLDLSIDPLLARNFGKEATVEIEKREGKLHYTRIEGEDQNPALDQAATRQGTANTEIAKLEADLAKAKGENERVQLREQLRQLRAQIASAKEQATSAEARIQRTPMSFAYLGGNASGRGFSGENPAKDAWYMFVDSAATMISVVLKAIAVLLPWLAALALLVALSRTRLFDPVRRWWRRNEDLAAGYRAAPSDNPQP